MTLSHKFCSPSGLKEVPEDIPDDTILLDLQNNKITEIKENDFKNLKGLQVSGFLPLCVLFLRLGDGLSNHILSREKPSFSQRLQYSSQVHGNYSRLSFKLLLHPTFLINIELIPQQLVELV